MPSSDTKLRTADYDRWVEVETQFRTAMAELDESKAGDRAASVQALAIRAGLSEIACELKSLRFAGRTNGNGGH